MHIAGHPISFGKHLVAHASGTRDPDRGHTPYQEVTLYADGSVEFKRNLPQGDGYNNVAGAAGTAPQGIMRW